MGFMNHAKQAEQHLENAKRLEGAQPDTKQDRDRTASLQAAEIHSRLALGISQMELAETQRTLASAQNRATRAARD